MTFRGLLGRRYASFQHLPHLRRNLGELGELGVRVVKLGTIIDEGEGSRFLPTDKTNDPAAADSQYDVPTFLRKQAD